MTEPSEDDTRAYAVVINEEERYSIWPAHREPPAGWQRTGFSGPKADCLAHIDEVWTDMRPKSLRERTERNLRSESSNLSATGR